MSKRILSFSKILLLLFTVSINVNAQDYNKEVFNTLSASNFQFRTPQWDSAMPFTLFPWVKKQVDGREMNFYLQNIVSPVQGKLLLIQIAAGDAVMEGKKMNMYAPDKVIDYVSMKKFAPKGKNSFNAPESCGRTEFPLLYHITGKQGSMLSEGFAGYAKGYAVYFIASYTPEQPLTTEWIKKSFFDWFTPLPNLEMVQLADINSGDADIKMLPAIPGNNTSNSCLIPASDKFPAKIEYHNLAEKAVEISLPGDAQGELELGGQKGKTVTATTDKSGNLTCWFYYTGKSEVKEQLKYEVRFRQEGKTSKGTIKVGLGLEVERIKQVQGEFDKYAINTPYPFVIQLRSRFSPGLNLGLYFFNAEKENIWNGNTLGVFVDCDWLNKPAGGTSDEIYKATCNIRTYGNNGNILSANGSPFYHAGGTVYPSVVLHSEGQHLYSVTCRPVVIKVADKYTNGNNFQECKNETLSHNQAVIGLSAVSPDTWFNVFQDMTCAFESNSWKQNLTLNLVKMIPVYGGIADRITTGAGILCNFTKGNYGDAFLQLCDAMGKEYISHISSDKILPTLQPREQKLAKLANDFKVVLESSCDAQEKTEAMIKARDELKAKVEQLYLESGGEQ